MKVRDLEQIRHKGYGLSQAKRIQRYTKCHNDGHNSRKCLLRTEELDDGLLHELVDASTEADDDSNNNM